MKNIHILPTDKPSRLFINPLWENQLRFVKNQLIEKKHKERFPQHIYITSNEELVLSGYHFNSKYGDEPQKTNQRDIDSKKYWEEEDYYITKIILTTDQDLISDGVQAIDDEFLEWFVNNTSCEEVEVDRDEREVGNHLGGVVTQYGDYKIIIPKEEPKCNCGGHPYDNSLCKIHGGIPKEEQCRNPLDCGKTYNKELTTQTITCNKCGKTNTFPFGGDHYCPSLKQETLEEAAFHYSKNKINKNTSLLDFTKGAKWQAKRMYSEEEVEIILKSYKEFIVKELKGLSSFKDKNHWFEQFKKK
jgi:hypothetical protein